MTTYDGTTNLQTAIAALCGCSIKSQATIAKLIKQAKESLGIDGKRKLPPQDNLAVYQWHYDRINTIAPPVELFESVDTLPPVEINQQIDTVANNTIEPIEAPHSTDEHAPIEQVETIAAAIMETFAICEPIELANNEPVEIMQRLPDNAMFKFAFYTHTYGVKNRQVIGLHGCYVNALMLAAGIDKKSIPAWIQSAVDSWGAFDDKLPITLQVKTLILRELESQLIKARG